MNINNWISVNEKLPTTPSYYFACWNYEGSIVSGEVWYDGTWVFPHYGGDEKENPPDPPTILYWMNIPLPPKEAYL